jgi:hypothetical protein
LNHAGQGVRLLWIDFEERVYRAMRLYPVEVEQCARFFRPPELLSRLEHPLLVGGFGAFRLRDLRPGEPFLTLAGEVCRVAKEQEKDSSLVAVWVEPGTVHTRNVLWHHDTRVFGTSLEQGRRIERRVARRRRGEKRKGA